MITSTVAISTPVNAQAGQTNTLEEISTALMDVCLSSNRQINEEGCTAFFQSCVDVKLTTVECDSAWAFSYIASGGQQMPSNEVSVLYTVHSW